MEVLFSKCTKAIEYANETKGFGCFYSEKHDANENIHLHECCELLFCISGGRSFFIDDRIYDVEDGDLFVLNQLEAHKITSCEEGKFCRFVMQIHPAFLYPDSTSETDLSKCFTARSKNISHKIPLSQTEREAVYALIRRLHDTRQFGDDILKNNAAVELLVLVNQYFYEKNKGYTYHSDFENQTVVTALRFINARYAEPISLEIVAKNCYVSVNELCRLFKKHMGTTVNKCIMSRKITEAKKLLLAGESVSQTAEKCGFSDYTSFIRAFKRAVGMAPGQYKRGSESQKL